MNHYKTDLTRRKFLAGLGGLTLAPQGNTNAQTPEKKKLPDPVPIDLDLDTTIYNFVREQDPKPLYYVIDMEKIKRQHTAAVRKKIQDIYKTDDAFLQNAREGEAVVKEITEKFDREYQLPHGDKKTYGTVEYFSDTAEQYFRSPETRVFISQNKDKRQVRVLFLERLPDTPDNTPELISDTGFNDEDILKKLAAKYRFTPNQKRSYTIFHEAGHLADKSVIDEGENYGPFAAEMLKDHKQEMLADVFSVLSNQKKEWNPSLAQALSDFRRVKAFNSTDDVFRIKDGEIWYPHGWYMTSKGIDAAMDWASRNRGKLAQMSLPEIFKKSQEITNQQHYSAAELQQISRDLIQAAAKLRWHAKGKFLEKDLARKLTPAELEAYRKEIATDHVNYFKAIDKNLPPPIPNPVSEAERFPKAIEMGLLPLNRPWVRSMKQSFERVLDIKIKEPDSRAQPSQTR